jgi:two-component system, cell cycle response regulator DivK
MKKSLTTRPLPTPPDEAIASQDGVLILVVDDMVDNLAFISLDLQQMGYRVVTACDGEQAIRVAQQTKPNIILMDLAMPGTDGLEASRKIHEDENLRHIPVVALTAHDTGGFKRAAADAGIDGYLTKPVDFVRLHNLIERLLDDR